MAFTLSGPPLGINCTTCIGLNPNSSHHSFLPSDSSTWLRWPQLPATVNTVLQSGLFVLLSPPLSQFPFPSPCSPYLDPSLCLYWYCFSFIHSLNRYWAYTIHEAVFCVLGIQTQRFGLCCLPFFLNPRQSKPYTALKRQFKLHLPKGFLIHPSGQW